jgi:hypothetical protein
MLSKSAAKSHIDCGEKATSSHRKSREAEDSTGEDRLQKL